MKPLIIFALMTLAACRPGTVEQMAYASKQIDTSYSVAYSEAADDCRAASIDWAEYDLCMDPWESGADAVRLIHASALALDVAPDKRSFKAAACRWYRAVAVFDAVSPVEVPAAQPILASKWNRKC